MGARITWQGDIPGELLEVEALHVTLRAGRAYPPGATALGVLHGAGDTPFQVKVSGSRREGEGFVVKGRLVNATVAVREAFHAATTTPA